MNWNWKSGTSVGVSIGAICAALGALFAHALQGCSCFWQGVPVGFLAVMVTALAAYALKRRTTPKIAQ